MTDLERLVAELSGSLPPKRTVHRARLTTAQWRPHVPRRVGLVAALLDRQSPPPRGRIAALLDSGPMEGRTHGTPTL